MNKKSYKYEVEIIYPCDSIFTLSFTEPHDLDDQYILEQMFGEWNHGSQCESKQFLKSKTRSLSVNDIVRVNGRYYQCLSFGWKQVTDQYVRELESDVMRLMMSNPTRYDAYFALHEVMYQRHKAEATKNSA